MTERWNASNIERVEIDSFGFPVPDALRRLLNSVEAVDGALSGAEGSLLHAVTGLILTGDAEPIPGTPPELYCFGRTGMDEIVCGCAIHDPSLATEYPLAMFSPSDCLGDYLGTDTRRSLGVLIGLAKVQCPACFAGVARSIAESTGFDFDELPLEQPLGVQPRIPPGWRFALTVDGLGVISRATQFEPDQAFDADPESFDRLDLTTYLHLAEAATDRGHFATALWHLRNGYAFWGSESDSADLLIALERTYRLLGRTQLSHRVKQMIAAVR